MGQPRVNIDGDIGVYRVGFASQDVPLVFAIARMDTWVDDICRACNTDQYRVFLTSEDKSNYRYQLYPDYKANRKSPKPIWYNELRQHLIERHATEVAFGVEADDLLGIAQSDNTILASIDKDLDQIPGKHYDFVKDILYEVSEARATRFFWYQLLMGDVTDNIKGIPGCGPKTAARILDGCKSESEYPLVVYEAYESAFGKQGMEMMILNGRLVKIQRDKDEPLWLPPEGLNIALDLSVSQQEQLQEQD